MTDRQIIERTTVTDDDVERDVTTETTRIAAGERHRDDEEAGGALVGGVGGAAVGAAVGGPVGAVVGGAVGAAAGATAGAVDEEANDHEVVVEHREVRRD